MFAALLAGAQSAALSLVGSVMTEGLFVKVISRVSVSLLKRMAKSTKTTVDDELIKPVVAELEKHY